MRVVFRQADLDTCLAAFILGVSPDEDLEVRAGGATEDERRDPGILCVEAGGSGEVRLRNFDHHDTETPLPPACRQALMTVRSADERLARLVAYAEALDTGALSTSGGSPGFPTLSSIVSGARLSFRDPMDQFHAVLGIIRAALEQNIDPFGVMPDLADWHSFAEAKRREMEGLQSVRERAVSFESLGGRRFGFLETDQIGALGLLYEMGCEVAIALAPQFRPPHGGVTVPKYTIGSRAGLRVDSLLHALRAIEPGWGGPSHGTVIASPREGSRLRPQQVVDVVRERL